MMVTAALVGKVLWVLGVVAWYVIRYPFERRASRVPIVTSRRSQADKIALALALLGLAVLWRGLLGGRSGKQGLLRPNAGSLGRAEGWRLTVLGLTLLGLGAAGIWDARWLLFLSLAFGFVEHYRYGELPDSIGAQVHLGDAWMMLESVKPNSSTPAQLGARTQSLTIFVDDVAAHYTKAKSAGATSEVPLIVGDVIRNVNGKQMTSLEMLRSNLRALAPGSPVTLQIQREGRLMYVSFTLE